MLILSKILFFFSHHGFYAVLIFILFFWLLSFLTKKAWWLILIIPFSIGNGFGGQFLNAWFLNKYGVESTAIITSEVQTNSQLNDNYIYDYEAIVKKQDGKYVETYFSTTSASIYPIENAIRIPSSDKEFPVKFIPGYEENIVILFNQSEQGKILRRYELMEPVKSARIKYEADRTNPKFIKKYIVALEDYVKVYPEEQFKSQIIVLKNELETLKK